MKRKLGLCFAVFLAAFPLAAREKSDVIVMRNGDKITCEVKALRSDTLFVKVDYILDTISVDWNKVDHIDSKQLFIVRTVDGSVYRGTLSTPGTPSGRPLDIEVFEQPEKPVVLERKQVVKVDQTSTNIWQRFNGEVDMGFNFTKGNETSQYSFATDVNYVQEHWSTGASYSSNLSASAGANVSTRNELTFTAQKDLRWNNWYYTGLADFLQSSVLGVQLQSTFGGGIGRNVVNTGATYVGVYGGFAWQQIDYQQVIQPAQTQRVTSALIGTEVRLFRFDRTTLTLSANVLPALSDSGRVQFNFNAAYYVKLWRKLKWNCSFYANLDNRPPPGFATSDYGATSGLSVSFGNH
jgi:hypothetical protein